MRRNRYSHLREKNESQADPDDGNSWWCSVCSLPIFSTPFIKSNTTDDSSSEVINYLHDQCANLPRELKGSVVHPGQPLTLEENHRPPHPAESCDNCHRKICGTKFYKCPDYRDCRFKCDVLCALTTSITILHRSHKHRLMAIRAGSASFICGACGTRHEQALSSKSAISYLCNACSFWIHPDCAILPNIIVLQHSKHQHQHPLVLNYYGNPDSSLRDKGPRYCAICEGFIKSLGFYSCIKCRYYTHIMCAVSDPHSFKPAFIREAQLPDLVRFPVPDENTSMVRYIMDSTNGGDHDNDDDDEEVLLLEQLHEHPLILRHNHDDNDDDGHPSRLCDACVQLIISPPFYSCSECPDFFLHNFCAHLPPTLTQHPAHYKDHLLSLLPKVPPSHMSSDSIFSCRCCRRPCSGFVYSCKNCDDFDLDVLCALMPASITHGAHAKSTHILYSSFYMSSLYKLICDCCGTPQVGLCYECRNCRNFRLHARCALLPNTISHRYDQHPLKLITFTTTSKLSESSNDDYTVHRPDQLEVMFCEICEKDIDNKCWCYSCNKCDNSFHIDCIPCLDALSKIKVGSATTNIHVKCHDCPFTLVRGLTARGYYCGYCGKSFSEFECLAFKCSKCYFMIHFNCVEQVIKEDVVE